MLIAHPKARLALAAALLLSTGAAQGKHSDTAKSAPMSDAQMIASAMRAAPEHVGRNATIMAMNADGTMRTLRQGTNGFTCIPDHPDTPGPDPMCMDKHAMAWIAAYLAKKPPPSGQLGFMYMLAGGTDASNVDPYATKPQGAHWIKTGPHVMIVGADDSFYAMYPHEPDPNTGAPYVMWANTPYQHLMSPVK